MDPVDQDSRPGAGLPAAVDVAVDRRAQSRREDHGRGHGDGRQTPRVTPGIRQSQRSPREMVDRKLPGPTKTRRGRSSDPEVD